MAALKELQQELECFRNVVKIKKRHLKEFKRVLNFYVNQVRELEKRISAMTDTQTNLEKVFAI